MTTLKLDKMKTKLSLTLICTALITSVLIMYSCKKTNEHLAQNDILKEVLEKVNKTAPKDLSVLYTSSSSSNLQQRSAEEIQAEAENPELVLQYIEKFRTDSVFSAFINSWQRKVEIIYNNPSSPSEFFHQLNTVETTDALNELQTAYSVDVNTVDDAHSEILTNLYFLYKENNSFFELSDADRSIVLEEVLMPDDPEVAASLTWGDFVKCGVEAVGAYIGSAIKVFKDAYDIITGYNLGFSMVKTVLQDALGTAFAFSGWKLLYAAGVFAWCLFWA